MADWLLIVVLYVLGISIVIAEIFLPAHGTLGLVGLLLVGYALYQTMLANSLAGLLAVIGSVVMFVIGIRLAVRNWYRMPVGRRIAPANPVLTAEDRLPVEDLRPLVGCLGRTLTPLRPVGTCIFNGQRVECTAEYGMIEKGVEVEAVSLVDRTISVRPVSRSGEATHGSR